MLIALDLTPDWMTPSTSRSCEYALDEFDCASILSSDDVYAIIFRRPERLKENLAVFDLRLTGKEMDQISRMTIPNSRLINELQWVPGWD